MVVVVVVVVVDVFAVDCYFWCYCLCLDVYVVLVVLVVLVVVVLFSWMSPHKSPPCGLQTSPGGVWKKLYVLFCIWSQRDPLHDNIIDVFCRQLSQVVFTNFVWCCTGNSIYFIHPINIDRELLLKLTPRSALRYSCPMSIIIITETDPVLIAIIVSHSCFSFFPIL